MNWFKKLFEKKVDERQEMDLLRVEHYGFWFMYWMLLAAIIIQGVILDKGDKILGEWVVFMATCVFVVIGWTRKGVWNYQTKKVPGVKHYLIYSLIAAVICGLLGALSAFKEDSGNLSAILLRAVVSAISTFVITFIVFLIGGGIAKKMEKKLELEAIEDDEDEEDE